MLRCPSPTCLYPLSVVQASAIPPSGIFHCDHCGAVYSLTVVQASTKMNVSASDINVADMLAQILGEAALDALHTWLDQNHDHASELAAAIEARRPELFPVLGFVAASKDKSEDPERWSEPAIEFTSYGPFVEEVWQSSFDPNDPENNLP